MAARDPRLRVEIVTQGRRHHAHRSRRRPRPAVARQSTRTTTAVGASPAFSTAGNCNCNGDGGVQRQSRPAPPWPCCRFSARARRTSPASTRARVSRGLRWLIENQGDDGDLRAGSNGNERHVHARPGGDRPVRGLRHDRRRGAARPGPEGDRFHRRGPVSRRRLALSARPADAARRHQRRRLAAHGPASRPGPRTSPCPTKPGNWPTSISTASAAATARSTPISAAAAPRP